jgi:hypothetical protein
MLKTLPVGFLTFVLLSSSFYDCFAFWTPQRGIVHSDSVNGVFPDLRTTDGTTWQDISANLPPCIKWYVRGDTRWPRCVDCDRRRGNRQNHDYARRRRHLERIRHSALQFAECGRLHRGVPRPWHGMVVGMGMVKEKETRVAAQW